MDTKLERVRVFNINRDKCLGLGAIVGYENMEIFGHICEIPKIILDTGEILFGSETWWGKVSWDKYPLGSEG